MISRFFVTAALAAAHVAVHAPLDAQSARPAGEPVAGLSVVEIIAEDHAFSAPDAIPSGWTTLRFRNHGDEPHMVFMSRLPEGRTIHDYENELSAPFSRAWHAVRDDGASPDAAMAQLFESLPAWLPEVQFVGGPGLAAAGSEYQVTMELEPGSYVLECYVKTEDGKLHYMEGMIRPITVTAARSSGARPAADIRITLANDGMEIAGDLAPGRRTVEVHVAENPEEGFGHSVHLARLEPGAEVEDVVGWLNWFDLNGLRTPAPARFIGGLHPMPAGRTAYFTLDLEPGRYLAVSEATGVQGVLTEFTIR